MLYVLCISIFRDAIVKPQFVLILLFSFILFFAGAVLRRASAPDRKKKKATSQCALCE